MGGVYIKKYIKKNCVILQIVLTFLLTWVTIGWAAEKENSIKPACAFSAYLENAENRTKYESMFARGRFGFSTVNSQENAAIYIVIAKSGYGIEHTKNLDSFSAGCLACHDGKSASMVRPVITNSPNKKISMSMIATKHPIGMDYEKYSASNKTLKSLDEMNQNLTLTGGRIGCVTCHDPLNPARNHLRSTKTGIDLCSACHRV